MPNDFAAPTGGGDLDTANVANAIVQALSGGGGQTSQSNYAQPYWGSSTKRYSGQYGGRHEQTSPRGWQFDVNTPSRIGQADAQKWLLDLKANKPARYSQVVHQMYRAGMLPSNAGAYDVLSAWDKLIGLSSEWANQGVNLTPEQMLRRMADAVSGGSDPFGGGGGSKTITQVSKSYNITDPQTAKAITNMVLSAALGRDATPDELKSYISALNAAEQASPSVTEATMTTDADGNSASTSTTTGGLDSMGKQQVLKDKAMATTEGQANTTSDTFRQAMDILAGL